MEKASKLLIILLYIFESISYISSSKILSIPFSLTSKSKSPYTDFIENIYYNTIYSNLTFGTPSQSIPFYLQINYMSFFLPSKIINKTNSETLKCSSDKEIEMDVEQIESGYYCTDYLNIGNNKTNINFILNGKKSNDYGSIGLLLPQNVEFGTYPFLKSLYNGNIINSLIWTLKFFKNISLIESINSNKSIGELIIGDEPHIYENDNNSYNKNNYNKVSPIKEYDELHWDLDFDNIYLSSPKKNNNITYIKTIKRGEIIPEICFIVGPEEYFIEINNTFFKKYFENGICEKKSVKSSFYFQFISCEKDNKFNLDDFPILSFEHKALQTTMNLTSKDLFVYDQKTNKYFFLIFNHKIGFNAWKLGLPFLKKHQFTFNEESKKIGYYISNINDYEETENYSLRYIIIIAILILIIIGIGILVWVLIKKGIIQISRKKRVNELLDDDFIYEENEKNKKEDESKDSTEFSINE